MLVLKYPKIFRDRYAPMNETCMCWGMACGDGWYNILNNACSLIQSHIDWTRKQRASALRYNRALERSSRDNLEPLIRYFQGNNETPTEWNIKSAEEVFKEIEPQCRQVPAACSQVVAVQVKEKFGGLRFYVDGGDDYTDGIIRMAEAMSVVTCEECGNVGTVGGSGWISTKCDEHRKKD